MRSKRVLFRTSATLCLTGIFPFFLLRRGHCASGQFQMRRESFFPIVTQVAVGFCVKRPLKRFPVRELPTQGSLKSCHPRKPARLHRCRIHLRTLACETRTQSTAPQVQSSNVPRACYLRKHVLSSPIFANQEIESSYTSRFTSDGPSETVVCSTSVSLLVLTCGVGRGKNIRVIQCWFLFPLLRAR